MLSMNKVPKYGFKAGPWKLMWEKIDIPISDDRMKEYKDILEKMVKEKFVDTMKVVDAGLDRFLEENNLDKDRDPHMVALFRAFCLFAETGSSLVKILEGTFMIRFFGPVIEKTLANINPKLRIRWGEMSLKASTPERNLPQNQNLNDNARAKIG